MHLSIAFSAVPEHGLQVELTDLSWFPEDIVSRAGSVIIDLVLYKKGENKVELRGRVEAEISLECDRCLTSIPYTVDSPIQVILEVPDSSHRWHLQDLELGEADIETIVLSEPVVQVGEILREQILLGVPEKHICSTDCLGLCTRCGKNLNIESCQCGKEEKHSPFADLAQYKIKKK